MARRSSEVLHLSRARVRRIKRTRTVRKRNHWGIELPYREPGFVSCVRLDGPNMGREVRVEPNRAPRDLRVGEEVWVYYLATPSSGLHYISRERPGGD